MGAITFSIDQQLAGLFAESLTLHRFVETGTFHGDSVAAMSERFVELHSIELSPTLWQEARARFAGQSKICIIQGNSADCLATLHDPAIPTLYWLDAHWCGNDGAAGQAAHCPLLSELEALKGLHRNSVIGIDDARLFLAPPPASYHADEWPSLQELLTALRTISDSHEVSVLNDAIWFYPQGFRPTFATYARKFGVDWLALRVAAGPTHELNAQLAQKEIALQDVIRAAQERLELIDLLSQECRSRELRIEEVEEKLRIAGLGTQVADNTSQSTP